MSRPAPILTDSAAGRVEALRVGVRLGRVGDSTDSTPDCVAVFASDDLSAGLRRLGDIELSLDLAGSDAGVSFAGSLRNASDREVWIERVVLGVRWFAPPSDGLRFLRHGWQSWSFTGSRDLDSVGEPPFPSGEWLRGMHHAGGVLPADRAGWHESDIVTAVVCGKAACLVGVLESGEAFGSVYLRRGAGAVDIEVELMLELPLSPGESRPLEAVRVALGTNVNALLESFAELWGRRCRARTRAPFQAGWCSWYQFFHEVSEQDMLRNLDRLAAERSDFGIDLVQLDDGYQSAIGDWLETNPRFPRGLPFLAQAIREAGFRAGIWTAPFCVVPESQLYAGHPDWTLSRDGQPFPALLHPQWSEKGLVYGLDTSQPAVLRHLESLYRSLAEMGFGYQKLDFLHAAAMRASSANQRLTRAQRLRLGLEAIRSGAGERAFLLGCGCPLGPAVGLVDGMRIGPDVAPTWGVETQTPIPGLEPVLPSLANALRNVLNRAWMHRRLWLNDPDCLLARSSDTSLSSAEIRSLAASISASGGMAVFSDDLGVLAQEDRRCIRETLALAREVDSAGSRGVARALDLLAEETPRGFEATVGADTLIALLNVGEQGELRRALGERCDPAAAELSPVPLLGSPAATRADASGFEVPLAPHEGALYRLRGSRHLSVFCDFDGTFAVQDVGATIARRWAGDRRPALWARYERGEIDAWHYNHQLFDGLALPEAQLDAFLKSIELDPGARELVQWCSHRQVPFRVLSDGFDLNLDRLQVLHDLPFDYDSNHLRYEGDVWRIEAGSPDPACRCGTGTCKRGRIAAHRAAHPGAFCVHIGNGRVSDLCGAIEADLCFAKDSLADALAERGNAFEPFETLHDVRVGLGRLGICSD